MSAMSITQSATQKPVMIARLPYRPAANVWEERLSFSDAEKIKACRSPDTKIKKEAHRTLSILQIHRLNLGIFSSPPKVFPTNLQL